MTLIHTFPPQPDESGRGYYRRLSSANALSSWKDLARCCGERLSFDALLAHPDHVSRSLGLEPDWCQKATVQDDLARTWRGLRRHGRDAVCVQCLRESVHLRMAWEHAYLVACPAHGVLLHDTCTACSTPLRFEREHIGFCECGFDLCASPSEPATPAQLWVSSLLATGDATVEGCGPEMERTATDVAAGLINMLCRQPDPAVEARRRNASAPSGVHELVAFLRPLEDLLANWPFNFQSHVSERLRLGPPVRRTLNGRLGTWYRQLRKLSDHEASHPFIRAVGLVAQAEFDGVLGLDATAEVINKEATSVLLMEAAKRIGVTYDSLLNHRSKGSLDCRPIKSGTNGLVYQVAVTEVEAIIEARRLWATDEVACTMLGVPPAVLGHLCDAGAVVREVRWKEDLRKGGPIELASLQRFTERLRSSTSPEQTSSKRIKLRELSARHVGDKKALTCALQAIATGALCAVKAEGFVGDYEYLWNDVAKHYARPLLDQGLTVQALSEATGYKHESISSWVSQGLLKSFDVLLRGQLCRVVTPTQFNEFRRQFVPLSDLARELGTKSSALAQKLGSIQIVGSQVLPGGERRGGLVRMADLARVAVQDQRADDANP
ncbi:TniQ family protein [Variovorax guangxiensis]|uniref:TniQ domain-containing protein n=1 Tax=Variovorax guangxiensis TaxID=1775474 RepID=A0A502DX17_9BURK|nr:TniQ family protein [Variovorax guangxiensis]TPG24967.1 hypothetical protein EAH83_11090 [Variovorax ginsengisoli]TPG29219.1 hypothetical protein EAH82_10750 [Variovorax guangxiensis]